MSPLLHYMGSDVVLTAVISAGEIHVGALVLNPYKVTDKLAQCVTHSHTLPYSAIRSVSAVSWAESHHESV